jgi:hypothetical protein
MHLKAIREGGGTILGNRPLEDDNIEPWLFVDGGVVRKGLQVLRAAEPGEAESLPVFKTWGYNVILRFAERMSASGAGPQNNRMKLTKPAKAREVMPDVSAPDSGHRLPSGITTARLTLLGMFMVAATGSLWQVFQLMPRVGAGRALAFLWTGGALATALAVLDGLALFWVERRRRIGYYMASVAVLVYTVRMHVVGAYSNVQPQSRVESVGAGIVTWAITAFFLWAAAVFYRAARLAKRSSAGVAGRAA